MTATDPPVAGPPGAAADEHGGRPRTAADPPGAPADEHGGGTPAATDPPAAPPGADVAAVHARLRARGETVAVAESLTGGLLAAALTETPGASATFRGGLVVYATELKARLAGVPAPLLDAQGAVSPDVAAALAGGVRDRLGATYGLGLTGVAGPEQAGGVPVGTVYLGLATPHGGVLRKLELAGDRAAVRAAAVAAALELIAEHLAQTEPTGSAGGTAAPPTAAAREFTT